MWVKMKRESVWGKAGKVIEVSESKGFELIQGNAATECEQPVKKSRKTVKNKAMTAKG